MSHELRRSRPSGAGDPLAQQASPQPVPDLIHDLDGRLALPLPQTGALALRARGIYAGPATPYHLRPIFGGIDKRVLAKSRAEIDAHVEYILPAMRARGGYIPTSDHGVPAEVPYEDYLYYRRQCVELGG